MTTKSAFVERLTSFNAMYRLPIANKPSLIAVGDAVKRLRDFHKILTDELAEVDEIIPRLQELNDMDAKDPHREEVELDCLTGLADWLVDIQVYCGSELLKFGIPADEVQQIVMDSNASKKFDDGPHYDENGKVTKGPYYWKPEPKIRQLLKDLIKED